MKFQLYSFGESGHSYKVALALHFSKASWEQIFIENCMISIEIQGISLNRLDFLENRTISWKIQPQAPPRI